MTRIAAYLAGIAAIAGLLCLPALLWSVGDSTEDTYEPTRITHYTASFTVDEEGDLTAVEDLDLEVTTGDRHGIYRFFDRYDPNAPHARRTPTDVSVVRDGHTEPYERQSQGLRRYVVLKIGDADTTLDAGTHHYTIRYTIPGVLLPVGRDSEFEQTPDSSLFYWNLVPGGWQQQIDDVDLAVSLPAVTAEQVDCTVGWGDGTACSVAGGGTDRLTVHLDHLDARTPVTIRSAVAVRTPPEGDHLPWTPRWDSVLGTSVPAIVVVLLLGVGGAVLGGLLGAKAREPRPPYPLVYAPPQGIGPAQAVYVLEERVTHQTFVASLLHATQQGVLSMKRQDKGWSIGATRAKVPGLDDVTRRSFTRLTGERGSFKAAKKDAEAGKRLKDAISDFTADVKKWGIESGNLSRTGLGGVGGVLVVAGLVLVLVCLVLRPFGMSMIGIIPGAFAVCGASAARTGAGTRRTRRGRELWSQVGGFKRTLETPSSKQRFDFSGRQELYTAYIPWAVAFGCAKEWAQKYRTEMGTEPPVPTYFAGAYAGAHTHDYVDSLVHDFNSTVNAAISSYDATQRSSGGGGGGGFSGGGGGGGGGGGSW